MRNFASNPKFRTMKVKKTIFRLLVHCGIHQIREGFEANLRRLPVTVRTQYADLLQEGITAELKLQPHLIVILSHESDSDFLLPMKIKLFVTDCPVLFITPAIPDRYYHFLKMIGIEHILLLPADDESICRSIISILEPAHHGKP